MKMYFSKYKLYFTNRRYNASVFVSFFLLLAGLIINYYAGLYATNHASNYVNDIVLSNTPVFNADELFVYGPLAVWLVVIFLCLKEPQKIPFVMKNVALFVFIRSIFVTLTHIAPFPDRMIITGSSTIVNHFTFGGDLFFSGHTGLPFLFALIFYRYFPLRLYFILCSIFFGVVVLLAHVHYSIDVLSAFFITYSIYHMSLYLFKEDSRMFDTGTLNP